jgi:hypothetical protein
MSKSLPNLTEATTFTSVDQLLIDKAGNPRRITAPNVKLAITGAYFLPDYYQSGDGTVSTGTGLQPDYLPAYNRIKALTVNVEGTGGAFISFPAGDFWFSGTVHLYTHMHIRGAGFGYQPSTCLTRLLFPVDTTGIRVWDGSELANSVYGQSPAGSTVTGGNGYSAANSCIEDLGVFCLNDATISGHGIHSSATVRLNRVNVQGFGEDGVRIFAYNPNKGSIGVNRGTGQADCWCITDSVIRSNKGNGLYVQGADANAGVAQMILGGNNGLWDFVDASDLGNTYVGMQSDGSGLGSFKNFAKSTLVGCYNESKATALDPEAILVGGPNLNLAFQSPALFIGGDGSGAAAMVTEITNGVVTSILPLLGGSGYTTAPVTPYKEGDGSGLAVTANIVGGSVVSYTITNGGSGYSGSGMGRTPAQVKAIDGGGGTILSGPVNVPNYNNASTRYLEAYIAYGGNTLFSAAAFRNSGVDTAGFFLLRWNEATKAWYTAGQGGSGHDNTTTIRWVSNIASGDTMGRAADVEPGSMQFPDGFWLGGGQGNDAGTKGRQMTNGTAAPSAGQWARGDIVWNTAPSAGGSMGWMCVTTGDFAATPPVFKAMPNLAA